MSNKRINLTALAGCRLSAVRSTGLMSQRLAPSPRWEDRSLPKVGRNDPCPCGSGKKFKRCCLDKLATSRSELTPSFAPSGLVETDAFRALLSDSETFRRFYSEVRPQLGDFVVVQDVSLPPGIRARTTWTGERAFLRVRAPVCPPEDATLVAHELGHLLLSTQGFPAVGSPTDHSAAAALNSAFLDPLVDAHLATSGFDLTPDRVRETEENMRQLKTVAPPSDAAGRAVWAANYLGCLLARHVLGEDPTEEAFLQWFSARHPSIANEADAIAAEVISTGFDTPDKMLAAMAMARRMLRAGDVITPPSKCA